MHYLLISLGLLAIFLLAGHLFVTTDPKTLAASIRGMKKFFFILALVIIALILILTGRVALLFPFIAFLLAAFGKGALFGLFTQGLFNPKRARKTAGQSSHVRTEWIDMVLNHDDGTLHGTVLKGSYAGTRLSRLSRAQLSELRRIECAGDPQSQQLLEAYLDKAYPDWVEKEGGGRGRDTPQGSSSAHMSLQEAYEILGLDRRASQQEVHDAHRKLMKKFHPDQGGSTYLATKINEAKELLTSKKS